MLWGALTISQNTFISGITLILGIVLLRIYGYLRKKSLNQNPYDQMRQEMSSSQNIGTLVGGTEQVTASYLRAKNKKGSSSDTLDDRIAKTGNLAARQRMAEQLDVELLTLSRQIKAEIDTKIVALQLMISDADRILQGLERYATDSRKNDDIPITPRYHESDRMKIIRQEETIIELPVSKTASKDTVMPEMAQSNNGMPDNVQNNIQQNDDLAHLNNIVIEDPFVESDFGFDKAMHELDQLSSNIPDFGPIPTFDHHETSQDSFSPMSGLPPMSSDWEPPMSYRIGDYRVGVTNDKLSDNLFSEPPNTGTRRRPGYTNKLLTQTPPQIDSLMTNETVRKMGSKPNRANSANDPTNDEPLVPPMIPKMPTPNAQAILTESAPYFRAKNELDKIDVRKAKRHQLQYLIDKGMSPKEIAAHLEMPVGEIELILSLHNRLSDKTGKVSKKARNDSPVTSKNIIPAEQVIIENDATSGRRKFHIIRESDDEDIRATDDGEQVA